MNLTKALLTTLLLAVFAPAQAAQTAQARLFCFSLRFQTGTATNGSTLALSSLPGPPNGELLPSGAQYGSGLTLTVSGSPSTGTLHVALPPFTDANGNGFDDFFEVAEAVGLSQMVGSFTTPTRQGTIAARWSRGAGTRNGTCVLTLTDNVAGPLGDFTHTFEVLEYTGPLSYTPGSSNVSTSLLLTQTGVPANTLRGPALFSKFMPGNFDRLMLRSGHWTNSAAQLLSFGEEDIFRDVLLFTNYYGYVMFTDGNLATAGNDYPLWQLSIDDLNDADADTVPDFSDAPATTLPRPPVLALRYGLTNLLLTIRGDVGRLHRILESTNFATGNWLTNLSVTLTNDPQTVALPLPPGRVKYWRALVE